MASLCRSRTARFSKKKILSNKDQFCCSGFWGAFKVVALGGFLNIHPIVSRDLDEIYRSDIDWERFRDKCVFITGGYGMLLSYITYALLSLNHADPGYNVKVVLAARDIRRAMERLGPFAASAAVEYVKSDLGSDIPVARKIDYIFHGASPASPHLFASNPQSVFLSNVVGTYNVLELARQNDVDSMLFFSSGAVYGDAQGKEKVCEEGYGYLDPLQEQSVYGESKKLAECMCSSWYRQHAVPVKIVRPAHIYGPTMQIEDDSRIVANIVRQVIRGEEIVVNSDGGGWRSFCYLSDATVAFFKVLLHGEDNEAYNVGNDSNYMSIRSLLEIVTGLYGTKVHYLGRPGISQHRGDKMLMMSDKLSRLGWQCNYDVKEGLSRTIDSYKG